MAGDVTNKQLTVDNSANAAGAQSIWSSGQSRLDLDQSAGKSTGASSGGVRDGSGNTVLGTGASIYNDVSADVAADAFAFGGKALDANADALAGSLGFGEKALQILSGFGLGSIESANSRADNAVAAVERLAAVPTDRNAAPPAPLNKNLIAGLVIAVLAFVFLWPRAKRTA